MHLVSFKKIRFITNVSYSMSSFSHPKQTGPVISVRLKSSLGTVHDLNSPCFARELGRIKWSPLDQHNMVKHITHEMKYARVIK